MLSCRYSEKSALTAIGIPLIIGFSAVASTAGETRGRVAFRGQVIGKIVPLSFFYLDGSASTLVKSHHLLGFALR